MGARKHFQGHSRRNPRSYPPGNTWNNPQRSPKSKALLRRGAAKPPALPGPFPGESWERSLGHCPEQSTENSSEQGMASARWALVRSQWSQALPRPFLEVFPLPGQCLEQSAKPPLVQGTASAMCRHESGSTPREEMPGTLRREVPRARPCFNEERTHGSPPAIPGRSRKNPGSDPWGNARNNPQRTPRSKAWLLRGGPS